MMNEYCKNDYVLGKNKGKWVSESGVGHRTFHSTAHSYIARHGREVWDGAYTFAVVRHPLARQVSNFFFLIDLCRDMETEERRRRCTGERLLPLDVGPSNTDEEKIEAFHQWMARLYDKYPPGSPDHYLMGSKGHGNEEYATMNATQTSWMVDTSGREIVVKEVFKLENLSGDLSKLSEAIPCLRSAPASMWSKNETPKYPHYSRFASNERTNAIMREVFGVDYSNFGYDM